MSRYPLQISDRLDRDRSRASAMTGRRLRVNVPAMVQPDSHIKLTMYYLKMTFLTQSTNTLCPSYKRSDWCSLKKQRMFIFKNHTKNTYVHYVGKLHSFRTLVNVIHVAVTVLWKFINSVSTSKHIASLLLTVRQLMVFMKGTLYSLGTDQNA